MFAHALFSNVSFTYIMAAITFVMTGTWNHLDSFLVALENSNIKMNTIGSSKVSNLFFEKAKDDYNLFKCCLKLLFWEKEIRIHSME